MVIASSGIDRVMQPPLKSAIIAIAHGRARLSRVIAFSIVVASCGMAPDSRLQGDVERYLVAMQGWAAVEREIGHALERILATHFVDDGEVRRQILDAAPRILRHLATIEAHNASTADVRALHHAYRVAWEDLHDGLRSIEAGLGSADTASLARGRAAIYQWRRDLRAIATDLRDLAASAGVTTEGGRVAQTTRPPDGFPGGVLLSHTGTVQYHRRWRA